MLRTEVQTTAVKHPRDGARSLRKCSRLVRVVTFGGDCCMMTRCVYFESVEAGYLDTNIRWWSVAFCPTFGHLSGLWKHQKRGTAARVVAIRSR
jgi:hypothetical protein